MSVSMLPDFPAPLPHASICRVPALHPWGMAGEISSCLYWGGCGLFWLGDCPCCRVRGSCLCASFLLLPAGVGTGGFALFNVVPAWSPHGLCAAFPKPTQPGREIVHSSNWWDTLLQAPSKKTALDLANPISLCSQISWWSQPGGLRHDLSGTAAAPGPAMVPVAEGSMCFTDNGG